LTRREDFPNSLVPGRSLDDHAYGSGGGEGRRVALDAAEVRRRLGLDASYDAFLAEIGVLEPTPVTLPAPAEALDLLARLRVPAADIAEAVPARPDPDRDPELCWLLARCRQRLVGDLGGYAWPEPWPALPAATGAVGRWLYLWVLLATVADVRAWHAEHGVPDEVSWATLADIGEKVGLHRRFFGTGGFDRQDWATLHFRGTLYALGRLQFALTELPPEVLRATGTTAPVGLGVHIPETGGPMTPAACDASLRRARAFFADHLGVDCAVATCTSWLLDDQLAGYLPATSNIVAFQRRFRPLDEPDQPAEPGDPAIVGFVFRTVNPDLPDLPRRTTLERAVVEHLRAGRHWRVRTGWLAL
jgi:hypothetical protein